MPLRTTQFVPGEYYHICVRGNNKQDIFRDDTDRQRLLFLIVHLQSPLAIPKINRVLENSDVRGGWDIGSDTIEDIVTNRYVALHAFAFMNNHIHIAVREEVEGGITKYMQRILNAYAKYFNTKYDMVGHLFQGPYRAVHVDDNEQLLYLSTYIHRNPRELRGVAGREHQYKWSSYQDYLGVNRFRPLLDCSFVLDQFNTAHEYREFVDSSIAKDAELKSFADI